MQRATMERELTRYWWAFGLRGAFAVLFGIAALVWPQLTLLALVILFGVYAIADGIMSIIAAFAGVRFKWQLLLLGIVGIAAGIIAFVWPGMTARALVYVIAAWALVTGVVEIAAAIRLRKVIEGEWLYGFGGLLSVVFGVLLMIFPGAGALSLVWLIGIYAIILGVSLIGLSLRLRRWHTKAKDAVRQPTARPTAGEPASTSG